MCRRPKQRCHLVGGFAVLAGRDARVRGVQRAQNGGVGAAFLEGMTRAIDDNADVIVKVDGDGQMNGAFVNDFAEPIIIGEADYVKGNRFFDIERVLAMPRMRLVGNAGLSFFSKLSTGYWTLFDPTNGYVAIHADVARLIPVAKLHQRYFFRVRSIVPLGDPEGAGDRTAFGDGVQ